MTSSAFGFASNSQLRNEAAIVPLPPAQSTMAPQPASARDEDVGTNVESRCRS